MFVVLECKEWYVALLGQRAIYQKGVIPKTASDELALAGAEKESGDLILPARARGASKAKLSESALSRCCTQQQQRDIKESGGTVACCGMGRC
jgi:hypothetical protein